MERGAVCVTPGDRRPRLEPRRRRGRITAELGLAVALTICSAAACAQASSSTQVGAIEQVQGGALNQQQLRIGDAAGSANSNVTVGSVVQTQDGLMNRQQLDIGSADDSESTRVDLVSIVRQPGSMDDPKAAWGKGQGGAAADRTAQTRVGASRNDGSDADEGDGGKTPPDVSGILHAQRRMFGDSTGGVGPPGRITNR